MGPPTPALSEQEILAAFLVAQAAFTGVTSKTTRTRGDEKRGEGKTSTEKGGLSQRAALSPASACLGWAENSENLAVGSTLHPGGDSVWCSSPSKAALGPLSTSPGVLGTGAGGNRARAVPAPTAQADGRGARLFRMNHCCRKWNHLHI